MKNMMLGAGALALLMAGSALGAEELWVVVGEDSEGNLLQFALPRSQAEHGTNCVLSASNPVCVASHLRLGGLSHGFTAYAGATGAASSILVSSSTPSVRFFGCAFADGAINCAGQGTFPAVGASFDQVCAGVIATASATCYITHG